VKCWKSKAKAEKTSEVKTKINKSKHKLWQVNWKIRCFHIIPFNKTEKLPSANYRATKTAMSNTTVTQTQSRQWGD